MPTNQDDLLKQINKEFPSALKNSTFDRLYPFCNELGYEDIVKSLSKISCLKSDAPKVSLLFGESNFLSLLPVLSELSDIVLLADINPDLHAHTLFLLQCFTASDTPEQFRSKYLEDNPALHKPNPNNGAIYDANALLELMKYAAGSLGKYHFLHSQSNFDASKRALNKISFVQIQLNLLDEVACLKLNSILHDKNAQLTLCNFTNIHNYVVRDLLANSVRSLLKGQENPIIMYSTGALDNLRSIFTIEKEVYIKNNCSIFNYKMYENQKRYQAKAVVDLFSSQHGLFSKKEKNSSRIKKIETCYFAFSGSEKLVQDILVGKDSPNPHSNALHALDSIDEVIHFVSEHNRRDKNGQRASSSIFKDQFFIFKMRGHKDKINTFLRYLDPERQCFVHYPYDMHKARMTLYSRIIEVYDMHGNLMLSKEGDCLISQAQSVTKCS